MTFKLKTVQNCGNGNSDNAFKRIPVIIIVKEFLKNAGNFRQIFYGREKL
jgi:hypothetical protein